MNIFSILPTIFGWLLNFIYQFIGNYGWALIIFTIITRALTMPLSIKSIKYTQALNELQPEINRLQERYKNDKERLAQEQMNLYKSRGVNPAGGCMPTILQLIITFSLFYAIIEPLRYQFGLPVEQIAELVSKLPEGTISYQQLMAAINPEIMQTAGKEALNMNFLGLNLGLTPTIDFNKITTDIQYAWLLIFPVFSTAATYISMKLSMSRMAKKDEKKKDDAPNPNGAMMWLSPIMTLYFSFIVPAGLSLYWGIGNIIQIIQQIVINKKYANSKGDK